MRPRLSLAGFRRSALLLPILVVRLTSSSSTAPSPDEAKESFTLAVVRRDSIAIPFATYDGKRWKNAWPMPASQVTAPIALSDVPKKWWSGTDPVTKWTFWPIDASGGGSSTLETIGPTWYPAHCQQGIGLRTTYSARELVPPPRVQPYPKAGLAVSSATVGAGGGTGGAAGMAAPPVIEAIQVVDIASSPLVTPLARSIVSTVFDEEKKRIVIFMRAGESWTHPYSDEERKETPLKIEALYKVARGLGEKDVYYFEGLKFYAIRDAKASDKKPRTEGNPETEPCDLVTFVSGWLIGREDELLKDPARIKPVQIMVNVTSCDFERANIMLPLGAVRVKDKAMWAVQWSAWTHEHYSVLDIKEDDLILSATGGEGGSCPRRD